MVIARMTTFLAKRLMTIVMIFLATELLTNIMARMIIVLAT